jgi:phage tail sheath protein FI
MPEYLAPGVYVEETSFRAKSIEGVSTTTTGFIGPTRYGPLDIEPEIITSLVEFERTYGGKEKLRFLNNDDASVEQVDNYMWHAARAFFEEGGKRLYVSRVFRAIEAADQGSPGGSPAGPSDGYSYADISSGGADVHVRARFPGEAGDANVTFAFNAGQNVLVNETPGPTFKAGVRSLLDRDVVMIRDMPGAVAPGGINDFFVAERNASTGAWTFDDGSGGVPRALSSLTAGSEMRVITTTVSVQPFAAGTLPYIEPDLPLDPQHRRANAPDSLFDAFARHTLDPSAPPDPSDPTPKMIASLARARTVPIVITGYPTMPAGVDVLKTITSPKPAVRAALLALTSKNPADFQVEIRIENGNDGIRPPASAYEGDVNPANDAKTGLKQFEDLEDISIVAAPGSTYKYRDAGYGPEARTIVRQLIRHAERMRYRIAVIDSGDNQSISEVRAMRAELDSTYGALYYPWIRVMDPLTQRENYMPPSGFVSGIYARNDINRAVYKAPANEVVNLALGFERFLNKSQQEVLNPEGVNCFRFFEGRGMRLWGARTISSDPEWKYVNLRRYFAYLERSIDKGTQWAVFEPNGEQLWANVRRTIEDFLLNEWQTGALLGEKPDKAYFVKCDRSTMSQNDLDNGRLICLIGVAPLRPAEFVIFRIGQWTADRKI